MRGTDEQQEWMFSYISAEKRIMKARRGEIGSWERR